MDKKTEVLLLDDEPIVCERLQDFLEKRDMAVESFNESPKALERLKEKNFDVVVADLRMEGPTGMDVLKTVRESGYKSELIINV